MCFLFNNFSEWKEYCDSHSMSLPDSVREYETEQNGKTNEEITSGLLNAFTVMKEAIETGLTEDMTSRSGMVRNGAKKVMNLPTSMLSPEFTRLIGNALAAKEVNSCMGRIVAAPTAGASGIMPGVLVTLQQLHNFKDEEIIEGMLVAAGTGLIIEQKASLAGAVGGCQAETGSAAAMAAGAVVYLFGGTTDQIFTAIATAIQCTLGLVCDPVAGLVEVPCIVRNASAASIAFSSATIGMAGVDAVIPVDECVEAMGEIGQSMETRYKETAEGGLANTKTARMISKRVLVQDIEILPEED